MQITLLGRMERAGGHQPAESGRPVSLMSSSRPAKRVPGELSNHQLVGLVDRADGPVDRTGVPLARDPAAPRTSP